MRARPAVGGVRARAREAMRAEVAAAVQDLVLERGYDATTVDEICTTAEISRSTFFRYFPSKEDALFGAFLDSGDDLRAALTDRPASEPPWTAMRRALDPLIESYDTDDERLRSLTRLIMNTPVLAARHRQKNAQWHELLLPEVASRLDVDHVDASDPRPHALIAAALGCVETALAAWVASDRPQPLGEILDRAMEAPFQGI